VVEFGIDFWREYLIDEPREMGLDEFKFSSE
jgi:hypothetical protein